VDDEIASGDPRLRKTVETVRRLKSGQFGRPFPTRLDGDRSSELVHDFFKIARAVGLNDYVRLDRSEFAFSVSVTAHTVRVAFPADVGSFTLHPDPVGTTEDLLRDSLLILAGLLARLNRFGEAVQVTRRMVGNCRATSSPDLALALATAAYELGDHELVIELAVDAFKVNAFDASQIYLLVLRQMPGEAGSIRPARSSSPRSNDAWRRRWGVANRIVQRSGHTTTHSFCLRRRLVMMRACGFNAPSVWILLGTVLDRNPSGS
jgi:hypothetical protein